MSFKVFFLICAVFGSAWSSIEEEYCRDKFGLDCTKPVDKNETELKNLGFENDEEYFSDICCTKGGGDRINRNNKILSEIVEAGELIIPGYNKKLEHALEHQGSPHHMALFWLLKDDEFFDINEYSEWLLQRFALAVFYFQMGGPLRWRDCWSGTRYINKTDERNDIKNEHTYVNGTSCSDKFSTKSIASQAWLSSTHECHWAYLVCDRNDFVTHISMLDNVMPYDFVEDKISYIQTAQNNVTLPDELAFLRKENLVKIDLRGNRITGPVPTSLENLSNLRTLNFHKNHLNGTIPSALFEIKGLEEINFGRNSLTGSLSTNIGNAKQLRTLHIGYNQLSGSIPSELGLLSKLEHIYLSHNNFAGSVPVEFCEGNKTLHPLRKLNADCNLGCQCCTSCEPNFHQECTVENTFDNESRPYGWELKGDEIAINLFKSIKRGCEFVELMDDRDCRVLGGEQLYDYNISEHLLYPRKECCHCGGCQDVHDWKSLSKGCDWYEENELFGCPFRGSDPNENGILASEACCWCGGGVPFSQLNPSSNPTITSQPSDLPSSSTTPTFFFNDCFDVEGWIDSNNMTCTNYTLLEQENCTNVNDTSTTTLAEYLMYNNTDGFNGTISAKQACCWCGGGTYDLWPTTTPSLSNFPSVFPTIKKCKDEPEGWSDIWGNTCENFELQDLPGCPLYGQKNYSKNYSEGLIFAQQACCWCGGGKDDSKPSISPSQSRPPIPKAIEVETTCYDIAIARPWPEQDCDWFSLNDTRCGKYGDTTLFNISNKVMSANEVCCACGGGTRGCANYPDWYDSHEKNFPCSKYYETEECYTYGTGYVNFGLNAQDACCVCGGGYDYNSPQLLHIPNKTDCFDELEWIDISEEYQCTNYSTPNSNSPDVDMCLSYGHLLSEDGVNASDACCNCRYGYDGIAGGYRGILRGRVLRVGFVEDNDIRNIYNYSNGTEKPTGIIYDLFSNFSASHGVGFLHKRIESSNYDPTKNDTYYACMNDILLNKLDLCLGRFWNTSRFQFPTTQSFYVEQQYLVVEKTSEPFYNVMITPFQSFSWDAWLIIIATIFLLGFTVDFITFGWTYTCLQEASKWSRFGNLIYQSVTLFLGKRPVTPSAKGLEKCAIFGFSIFTLFVVSTFMGSITASIVKDPSPVRYNDLDHAISLGAKICTYYPLRSEFLLHYPEASDLVIDTAFWNANDLINGMRVNNCDAVIMSAHSFQNASNQTKSICDNYAILHEVLYSIEVVLPLNNQLQELGTEMISRLNHMLSKKGFDRLLKKSLKSGSVGCAEKFEENLSSTVNAGKILLPSLISIVSSFVSIVLAIYFKSKSAKAELKRKDDMVSNPDQEALPLIDSLLDHHSDLVLYKFISKCKRADQLSLDEAMHNLPDKAKLMKLAQSDFKNLNEALKKLSFAELLNIIMKSKLSSMAEAEVNRAVSSSNNKESALINIILSFPEITLSAIDDHPVSISCSEINSRNLEDKLENHNEFYKVES